MHEGCQVVTKRYSRVNEAGTSFGQYYAECVIHATKSPHDFHSREDAWRFFRCDPENHVFLFADVAYDVPPFTGDLTELIYQVHCSYQNQQDGIDGPVYYIYEVTMDKNTGLHCMPISYKVIGSEEDKENDMRYSTIEVARVYDGHVFGHVNVRNDLRG